MVKGPPFKMITHGVPHGSVLGPLLFIIFINVLPKAITKSVVDIYADNTTVSASATWKSSPSVIQDNLQEDVDRVTKWSFDNKIILNSTKTKTMFVTGKRLARKFNKSELSIFVQGEKIAEVQSHKLLGVKVDKELNFSDHVDDICKKLVQRIGVLNKFNRHLPLAERKLYYNSMVKLFMMYGCTVWSSFSCENIDRVYKFQKRAARVILDADTRERSAQLFKRKLYYNSMVKPFMMYGCTVWSTLSCEYIDRVYNLQKVHW
jgi:hypothetical protein